MIVPVRNLNENVYKRNLKLVLDKAVRECSNFRFLVAPSRSISVRAPGWVYFVG